MYKLLLYALCGLFALNTIACHDHNDDEDTVAPVLTIEEPAAGESISGEVHFHGTVTDDKSLHEFSIQVTKDSDNASLFTFAPTVHDLTVYSFDEHWTPSGISAETDVTVTFTVEDHGGNKTVQSVKFKVKP